MIKAGDTTITLSTSDVVTSDGDKVTITFERPPDESHAERHRARLDREREAIAAKQPVITFAYDPDSRMPETWTVSAGRLRPSTSTSKH